LPWLVYTAVSVTKPLSEYRLNSASHNI